MTRNNWPSLVDEFFGKDLLGNFIDGFTGVNTPAVNILDEKDDFRIEVAAPGLKKDDFKIDLNNNVLTISSERTDEREDKKERYMRREFSYSSFKRSFTLPDTAQVDKISANHKDGILQITIPKKEEAKVKPPRQIAIQ
ncbi:MAG TPA: Hsp20/alpha crystallin family protein [Bacteroidales bacterium]|nr:Hsp20/alpha crystallin family protein [Bacteroidales bacterium]